MGHLLIIAYQPSDRHRHALRAIGGDPKMADSHGTAELRTESPHAHAELRTESPHAHAPTDSPAPLGTYRVRHQPPRNNK